MTEPKKPKRGLLDRVELVKFPKKERQWDRPRPLEGWFDQPAPPPLQLTPAQRRRTTFLLNLALLIAAVVFVSVVYRAVAKQSASKRVPSTNPTGERQ